jgi:hypothetical protein
VLRGEVPTFYVKQVGPVSGPIALDRRHAR